MKKYRNLFVLTALIALMAVIVVGCGSSDNSSDSSSTGTDTTAQTGTTPTDAGAPTESVALAADPGGALAYVQKTLDAKAGNLSIAFTNESPIGHNVAVDDAQGNQVGESDVITGSSTTLDIPVKPGKYTYYCTLPGHEEAGMKGTLTVK